MPERAPGSGAAVHREALVARLGAAAVRWDDETLAQHSRDTWCLSQLRALRGALTARPLCVVSPNSVEQVSALLAYANARRLAVVPFGAGSGVCGGVLPDDGAVVVDMRRMDEIVELNETALTVRVQAGMMGNAFEAALNAAGYSMGHFPQSIDVSTVGGWVATRAAGQYSTRYGSIEDLLLALEVVLPDGRVLRTRVGPRAATGPDLRQLFLGSEGTLGIVTELTARIFPRPASSVGQAYSFASMHDGLEAIRLIMRAGWRPPVVRLYDGVETARLFTTVSTGDNCLLLLISEGPPALTAVETAACAGVCTAHGGTEVGTEPVQHWLAERNQVPGFESFLQRGFVLDTIEVATTWDHIHDLYREVIAALQTVEGVIVASGHSSHSYAQGTNIYFTFVARPEDPVRAEPTYLACWRQTMEATLRCHGTIAHHHGIGRLRTPWMERELGATGLAVLRALKHTLDPNGIMNPGALIPPVAP
ncbi:MAG TPA: FAD-binding oxidoreductase [Candidatus Acidoferrales bacterium]|nr:FAD-binding oxidoreductase [Candidatus Acidoferrales bacterium]